MSDWIRLKREQKESLKEMVYFLIFCSLGTILSSYQISSISASTITPSQSIKDGKTLVSQSNTFELGFFSPPNSKNRYLGIWYRTIPEKTIVWVANRDSPLNDSSGVLLISSLGNLVIQNGTNKTIWSTNSSKSAKNPIVDFLESGNLVLKDAYSDEYLWESFDYPSDTLLPGMKLGWDLRTGLNRNLTSWKSSDDPSHGDFTWGIDLNGGYPEIVMRNGSKQYHRSGPWNGVKFSGSLDLTADSNFIINFVEKENEVYYMYHPVNQSVISISVLKQTGKYQRLMWVNKRKSWLPLLQAPSDTLCDAYGFCGSDSTCYTIDVPVCRCLKGFKPRSPNDWKNFDWSQGCERVIPLVGDKGDGFQKLTQVKLPDTKSTWTNRSMNLEECREKCLTNSSCMAYTTVDIRGAGSGCAIWFGDLIDIRGMDGAGQDLYIRMAASQLAQRSPPPPPALQPPPPAVGAPPPPTTTTNAMWTEHTKGDSRKKKSVIMIVSITLAAATLVLSCWGCCHISKKKKGWQILDMIKPKGDGKKDDFDLPLFDLVTISAATNNFSEENKLGQGGYGPVFKGKLAEGQEIAAKRLSKISLQGPDEFKNEILLISKLQHRNLVRLLGCCIQGEEKMLIYEYMPNRSLDYYIFGKIRSEVLDWQKRFHIIMGIARGLLYLHQDSRMRIIHRDLKTSNILLDSDMTPKISDFGMARIFGGDQVEANTNRVVGTHGYMSPEYAGYGRFSIKSDVFSFGVIVLEIVSGKKNRGFHYTDHQLNLLGHAWRLWSEGKALDLVDESMGDSFIVREVLRCIHTGLLCVQQGTQQRPTMSSVVTMLSSEDMVLPQPEPPGFYVDTSPVEFSTSVSGKESFTLNEVTDTILEGR